MSADEKSRKPDPKEYTAKGRSRSAKFTTLSRSRGSSSNTGWGLFLTKWNRKPETKGKTTVAASKTIRGRYIIVKHMLTAIAVSMGKLLMASFNPTLRYATIHCCAMIPENTPVETPPTHVNVTP